jgi:ATP-dependent exoDNAse (exonuclease V) alpha subunit
MSVGLCNGTVGYVKDIVYRDEVDCDEYGESIPPSKPPCLPKYVWVNFGNSYRGPSFFDETNRERRGWVPVYPITSSVFKRGTDKKGSTKTIELSRTMLPLRLAWAWTFWKAQGQTFRNKIIMNLSNKEKENGLTYTGFSRATKLSNIGIIG